MYKEKEEKKRIEEDYHQDKEQKIKDSLFDIYKKRIIFFLAHIFDATVVLVAVIAAIVLRVAKFLDRYTSVVSAFKLLRAAIYRRWFKLRKRERPETLKNEVKRKRQNKQKEE